MTQRIFVCLGRLGDCLSFLPVLHAEQKNGQRCALMVAQEFTSVLDGVSYADKLVFAGEPWEIGQAMASAWQLSSSVCCVQVAGPPELVKQHSYAPAGLERAVTDSFVKEAWRLAGHFPLWKTQPPLLFDRRDQERETKLLKDHWPKQGPMKKKVILVSTQGKTSPFPYRDLLFKLLRLNFLSRYAIVDLDLVQAERIYDLLALYEKAHCLVAVDSAPLHLAQACPNLPVVALASDRPSLWHGAPWRANHICYVRYGDFPVRALQVLEAIEEIGSFGTIAGVRKTSPRLIHCWSQYDLAPDNEERHKLAVQSWRQTYAEPWLACRIDLRAIGKDSHTALKDDRPFPGLKEVVRLACFRAKPEDVIVLTRADTCFGLGLAAQLLAEPDLPKFARRTLREEAQDTWHPVADLFAFSKSWWDEHGKELPDFILGQDHHWPRCLMQLILEQKGSELLLGSIYRARAKQPTKPVQRAYLSHNERIGKEWLAAHGGLPMFPAVSRQVTAIRVNPQGLLDFGYNPSLIRFAGRLLMAYRYHVGTKLSTKLALAELDDQFNVTRNSPITIPGQQQQSAEDPRLFTFHGQLWITWVDADWPSKVPTCVVKLGRLVQTGSTWNIEDAWQPVKEGSDWNTGKGMDKNWVFWEHKSILFWLHGVVADDQVVSSEAANYYSPAPHWPWGQIRGGTSPLPYRDKLLRFFHSSLDFEQPPEQRRYFMGAALMEPEPPFATVAVSQAPICIGSELDDLSESERGQCLSHKAKVIFPAGAVIQDDGWLVSAGCNDNSCLLLQIKEKDLHL